jgi:hypothetical protein
LKGLVEKVNESGSVHGLGVQIVSEQANLSASRKIVNLDPSAPKVAPFSNVQHTGSQIKDEAKSTSQNAAHSVASQTKPSPQQIGSTFDAAIQGAGYKAEDDLDILPNKNLQVIESKVTNSVEKHGGEVKSAAKGTGEESTMELLNLSLKVRTFDLNFLRKR